MDLGLWGEGQGRGRVGQASSAPRGLLFSQGPTPFFRPQEGDEDVEAEKAGPEHLL